MYNVQYLLNLFAYLTVISNTEIYENEMQTFLINIDEPFVPSLLDLLKPNRFNFARALNFNMQNIIYFLYF